MPKSPVQTSTVQQPPSFGMDMTDDALVTFGQAAEGSSSVPFTDEGYMPVNMKTLMLGDNSLHVPGGLDGVYIHYYNGTGVQTPRLDPTGTTAIGADITYTGLQYDLVGYKGKNVSFDHAAGTNAPTLEGTLKQTFELAHGSLDTSQLSQLVYTPAYGKSGPTVAGDVYVSVMGGSQQLGDLKIHVSHSGSNEIATVGNQILLSGGALQAVFLPA